jgi:DNA-binding beta-propeller fold protein YncE
MLHLLRRILESNASRVTCVCLLATALASGQEPASDELPVLGGARLTIGALDTPRGVLFGPEGEIFAVESGSGRVRVFGPDGVEQSSFASQGRGHGELLRPEGIARTADGRVWVADSGNHRVAVFDATGAWVANHGGPGSSPGRFHAGRHRGERGDRIAVADSAMLACRS